MTDRELLELAAKAAGYGLHWLEDEQAFYGYFPSEIRNDDYPWNPLTDDGDALRLAVKLIIGIDFGLFDGVMKVRAGRLLRRPCLEDISEDPYAATRRAIVRAASEIGKGME